MLQIRDLHVSYGNIRALRGVDLDVGEGEIIAILGPNGAGKSTLIKTIIGVLPQARGTIRFQGEAIDGKATAQRIRLGLGTIPEGRQLFPDMSVRENLILGAYARLGFLMPASLEAALDEVFAIFPRLREREHQLAGSLSGGEQQMLALGRAVMLAPRILLVDEPSVGLAPILVSRTIDKIKELKDQYRLTVLMAEQNFTQAIRIANRGYVIVHGKIAFEGKSADELNNNDLIRKFYLGL
jgi:branched-chain amino acid transport system ATP-binding protein